MPQQLLNAHGACALWAQLEHLPYLSLFALDDVIVYVGNFYDALDRLKTVWQRTREGFNLKLKPSKCCLMCYRVPFLGHYVLCDGVKVDPTENCSCVGLANTQYCEGRKGL